MTARDGWMGALLGLLLAAVPASAKDDVGITAEAAFARLKGLAGEWPVTIGGHDGAEAKVSYRVVSGGHTLMETDAPGTEHEMVSMYHLDGDDLRMTHYCSAGNQPRLKLDRRASTADRLVFAFDGGTNFDPAVDLHIHAASFTFEDGGRRVVAVWEAHQGGKPTHSETFVIRKGK